MLLPSWPTAWPIAEKLRSRIPRYPKLSTTEVNLNPKIYIKLRVFKLPQTAFRTTKLILKMWFKRSWRVKMEALLSIITLICLKICKSQFQILWAVKAALCIVNDLYLWSALQFKAVLNQRFKQSRLVQWMSLISKTKTTCWVFCCSNSNRTKACQILHKT